MIININNKKISAGALALKWPSVLVACKVINGNTYIEWDEASIPAKTEAEIKSAQDAYETGACQAPVAAGVDVGEYPSVVIGS